MVTDDTSPFVGEFGPFPTAAPGISKLPGPRIQPGVERDQIVGKELDNSADRRQRCRQRYRIDAGTDRKAIQIVLVVTVVGHQDRLALELFDRARARGKRSDQPVEEIVGLLKRILRDDVDPL